MNSRPKKQLTGLLLTLAFVLIPLAALCAGAAASPAAPTPSPTPALVSNGAIAFMSFASGVTKDIYVVNPDGTGTALLINANNHQEDPAWSADGKYIAYASAQNGYYEIYRADADGSNQTRLSDGIDVGAVDSHPAWSPDGQKIVFVRNHQLWTVGKDGGTAVKLSTGSDEDEQPAWSPDGTKIAFVRNWSSATAQVWVMNADGTNQVNLSNDEWSFNRTPAWSPDGSKIAFHRFNHIWVMDADGSNQTQLTFPVGTAGGGYDKPSWSPDGTQIAVNGLFYSPEIFVMNADGSNIRKIADGSNPSWQSVPPLTLKVADSPDPVTPGTELTYTLGVTNNNALTATGATLTDALDAGTTFVSATASRGSCATTPAVGATGTVTCSLGDLAAGEQATVTLVVHVAAAEAATLHNAATAAADYAGYDQQTQSVETSTQVLTPSADVYTSAWAETLYVPTGGQVVYNAYVFNGGPEQAADVTLTSNFPAGVTLAAVNDDGGGSCAPAADGVNFTCTFASINPFYGYGVRVTANSNVAGAPYAPVSATFTAASTTHDNEPFNNSSTADFLIPAPPLPTPTPGATDDGLLAFGMQPQSSGQHDIYRQRADGAGVVNLTDNAAYDDSFAWSPDGSRLAFLRYDFEYRVVSLGKVAADGSGLTLLTSVPGEYIESFSWSPDGSRFVFSARPYVFDNQTVSDVFVINADGTGRTNLTNGDGYNNEPSWSHDGAHIAYVRATYGAEGLASSEIRVVGAGGSGLVQIPQGAGEIDTLPRWSPDGARLAFRRVLSDGSTNLHTARADGTDLRRLTDDAASNDTYQQWSPDGSKLSFDSYRQEDGTSKLEVVNADGTGRATIYEAPADGSGSFNTGNEKWSPDSSHLVFQVCSGECVRSSLYVIGADGAGRVELGDGAEQNGNADWSPDGQRLAFTTNRNGVNRINLIKPDGTGRVELPGEAGFYGAPKWRPAAQPSGDTPAGANVTVAENGVAVTFSNVTTAGETTVTPIDPNSLQGVPGEYVINAGSLAFEIHTTAVYAGPITLGFQVPGITNPITFSALRVLHGEPPPVPNFVDRTVLAPDSPAPNFPTRTVYARVTSLSPFVVAQLKETVPPTTAATLSAPANAAGWHKAAVSVTLSASDGENGSGVQSLTYSASGAQNISATSAGGSTATINVTAEGTTTVTFNARDNNGNVEAVKTVTVRLDKTAPSVNVSSPTAGAAYTVGQAVNAGFNCNDGGSGVVTCAGTKANGSAIDTSAGAKEFAVTATDAAGNTAQKTVSYTASYGVVALYDQTKSHKSGSTVPIKLQLTNAGGANVSSAGLVVTALGTTLISTNTAGELEDAGNSNPDFNFRYSSGGYIFNLKTTGYALGTYALTFRVAGDPVTHTVQFRITK